MGTHLLAQTLHQSFAYVPTVTFEQTRDLGVAQLGILLLLRRKAPRNFTNQGAASLAW
nr:hypothetical protein [Ruficoccus amylovorans]